MHEIIQRESFQVLETATGMDCEEELRVLQPRPTKLSWRKSEPSKLPISEISKKTGGELMAKKGGMRNAPSKTGRPSGKGRSNR